MNRIIATLILVSVFSLTTGLSIAQQLVIGSNTCSRTSIRVSIVGDSRCSGVKVTSPGEWSVSPAPTSFTVNYTGTGSNKNYSSIDVVWNAGGMKTVSVANYTCSGRVGDGNPVTSFMVSDPVTPSVTINGPTEHCPVSPGTFIATAMNAGVNPTIGWRINGNVMSSGVSPSNTSVFTPLSLSQGDVVNAFVVAINGSCFTTATAESNVIAVSVLNPQSTVSIIGPASRCPGDVATFNVVSTTNAGTSPGFNWYVNGQGINNGEEGITISGGGTHMQVAKWSYDNNSIVTCSMISNSSCHSGSALSNAITVSRTQPRTLLGGISVKPSLSGGMRFCQGEAITFNGSSSLPADLNWSQYGYTGTSGASFTTTDLDPDYDGSNNKISLRIRTNEYCVVNPEIIVNYDVSTIQISPSPSDPVVSDKTVAHNSSTILTARGAGDQQTYNWYAANGDFLSQGNLYATPVLTQNEIFYVAIYNSQTSCSSAMVPFSITVNHAPLADAGQDQVLTAPVSSAVFSGSATDSDGVITGYSWAQLSGPPLRISGQDTGSLTVISPPGGVYTFRLTVTDNSGLTGYDDVNLTVNYFPLNRNFIKEERITLGGIVTPSSIDALTSNKKNLTIDYFDGIGRSEQVIDWQASPLKKDIVTAAAYDRFGRDSLMFLPFASNSSDSYYKQTATRLNGRYAGSEHSRFYSNGSSDGVADDSSPFARATFESNPLNRVLKQGSPGSAWQPDATNSYNSLDKTIKKSYEMINSSEVLQWTYAYPSSSFPFGRVDVKMSGTPVYSGANTIRRTRTRDEHGNDVIEYVNHAGKPVLKRIQAVAGQVAVNDTTCASTYYIYDDFQNLVCVIPPEATRRLPKEFYQAGATATTKEAFLSRWAFRYRYDGRKRVALKQVPGVDSVKMVYDKQDRLIMTQDGNQRATSVKFWSFTKYDQFGRVIMTGIRDTAAEVSQQVMQSIADKHFSKRSSRPNETYIGATPGNVHGYSNRAYPARTGSSNEIDPDKYLTIKYYDNYDFKSRWIGEYGYMNEGLSETDPLSGVTYYQPPSENLAMTGQLTGSKTKILDGGMTGSSTWLKSVTYYDDKYRVIQTLEDNYKGGVDRLSIVVDFSGKTLKSKETHVEADVFWTNKVGVKEFGTTIVNKNTVDGWNTSGAVSRQQLAARQDGWFEMTTSSRSTYQISGLSDVDTDQGYASIDFAFYQTNGYLFIFENGIQRANLGSFVPGEVLRIERKDTTIMYRRNGNWVYTSPTSSKSMLMVDAAIYSGGASLAGIRSSFSTTSHVITRRFVYDHKGRLTNTFHRIDMNPEILLAQNSYNEMGQLIDKKLHSKDGGATFKQSADFRYNIRGWLLSVNNSRLTNDAGITNNDSNDLFGFELGYNEGLGTSGAKLYNGNIQSMKWSSNLGLGLIKDVAYNYTYDPMGRLLGADFLRNSTSGWGNSLGMFSENGYSYDLNGNIKGITRKDSGGSGLDILSYNYGSTAGNQLAKVSDAGDKSKGFIEPASTPGNDYLYDANGNMTLDQNKGISSITYNALNLPMQVVKGTDKINYYYDATGRKWSQIVTSGASQKKSDYVGMFFYENDTLQFISTDEGRVVMKTPGNYEYQYNLKDHLGNVRITFTTANSRDIAQATLENAKLAGEQSNFLRYGNARRVYAAVFDHTNGSLPGYSQRLNGTLNEKFGIARSLSVMPGDTVKLEVYGKYVDSNTATWTAAFNSLMAQVSSQSASVVIDGASYASSTASFPFVGVINTAGSTGGPKAYLNWAVFDNNYNVITAQSGYARMGTRASEHGQDTEHEKLESPNIIISQPGYVYTWLSNEENVEVYFDDFKVTLARGPVVQMQDYYPFGMTFNKYQRENSLPNSFQYNGKEKQDELGLDWLDYGARMYMPEIGRWGVADPVSESYFTYSPYNYVRNNPILRVDEVGNWDITVHVARDREKYGYGFAVLTDRNGNELYHFYVRAEGVGGRDRMVTDSDTPLGVYDIPDENMWRQGYSIGDLRKSYGQYDRLVMNGQSGEIIDSGRDLIRIHGGRQETYNVATGEWERADPILLERTKGCLRAYDSDVRKLKEITDNLKNEDGEEFGGTVTVVDDLDEYMRIRTEQNEEQMAIQREQFWSSFGKAFDQGIDSISNWLKEHGYLQK